MPERASVRSNGSSGIKISTKQATSHVTGQKNALLAIVPHQQIAARVAAVVFSWIRTDLPRRHEKEVVADYPLWPGHENHEAGGDEPEV